MAMSEAALQERARRAYERGRTRWAAARSLPILPAAALAFLNCNGPAASLACVAMVSLLMFVWLRRGEDHARGARAGLLAGLAPLAMPPAAQAYALWQPATAAVVPAGCLLGGLLGGVVLAVLGTRAARASRDFWIAALTVCLAAGAGGCLFAGLLGLTGMALGLGLGAAPLLAARRA